MSTNLDLKRNEDLAGQSIRQGDYTIRYNEDGYASAVRDYGQSATTTVKTTHANDSPLHQAAYQAAQAGNWDAVGTQINKLTEQTGTPLAGGGYDATAAQQYLKELQDEFNYDFHKVYFPDQKIGTTKINAFEYGAAPTYTDNYQAQIDAALDKILNRDAFSYNAEEDPIYQQYREAYTRDGARAKQDTLGQASARTGGLASSYATTAAQQANQMYMQELADKIPELQQLAYQMYLDDVNLQVQDLGLLQGASQDAYNRYRDTMSDYYTDRDFAYGTYRDGIADTQWQTQYDYNAERDSIADQRYDTEWNYQLSRDEIADQRYNTEWAYQQEQDRRAAASAAAASASKNNSTSYSDEVTAVAAYLGLSEKEANALKNVGAKSWNEALEALGIGGSGGGNGGSSGNTSTKSNDPPIDMNSVAAAFGPISEAELARLVKSGEAIMYVEDGKTKFRKANSGGQSFTSMYDLLR